MSSSRLESLHAQLSTLLENAQYLLADSAPNSYYGISGAGGGAGMVGGTHALSASGPKPLVTPPAVYSFVAMQAEIRTLEFWRSIIAECIATFFYVTIVLSVATSSPEAYLQTNSALAAGLSMVMLTACFARVSGCHTNPAITVGTVLAKHISPLRAVLYMCAQCGGSIAGAALVLGVHGKINDPALVTGGGTFGMEFVLTFLIVYAFCASRDPPTGGSHHHHHYRLPPPTYRPQPAPGNVRADAVVVGVAYAACLVCWRGSLNPARALGSAFVSRATGRFQQHWVFWVGPILGAITGAFAYEYIFNTRRRGFGFGGGVTGKGGPHDLEQISVRSEDDMLDDLERAKQYKANIIQDFQDQSSAYSAGGAAAARAMYNKRAAAAAGLGGNVEPVYGGTKSMFNQPIYDRYQDGSKSCYSGYDGGPDSRNAMNLRRSRSIHAKFPGVGSATPGTTRRNPYDYLPDEPSSSIGGKPDIMQSSMVTENGTSRLMGNKSNASPRYLGGPVDKLSDAYDSGIRSGGDSVYGRVKEDYESAYGKTRPYGAVGTSGQQQVASSSSAVASGALSGVASSAVDHYGTTSAQQQQQQQQQGVSRGDFQRMSRMRGGAVGAVGGGVGGVGGGSDFYSPQYNASYSQQNGCSITTNSVSGYSGSRANAVNY